MNTETMTKTSNTTSHTADGSGQFTISREAMIEPLQAIMNIVEKRNTLPILANALFEINDNIHTIGNKIIKKTFEDLCKILVTKKKIKFFKLRTLYKTKIYKRKDFNRKNLRLAMKNIKNRLVLEYISKYKNAMERKYPIISQL